MLMNSFVVTGKIINFGTVNRGMVRSGFDNRGMKKFLGYIFSALMLAACASELDDEMASEDCGILVNAQCADTKSIISSDLGVIWNKEDRITVLSLDGETVAVSEPAGADADACDFKVSSWPEDKEPRYAVFNGVSDEASASIEGRYIRTSIKTTQLISDEASFGRDANLSVGELKLSQNGEWQTRMKNVCALVGFSLERFDNVKTVSIYNLAGNDALSGIFEIFMEDGVPVIKNVLEGKTYVAASMADGTLEEAWGCGTAAVVSPIGELCYKDQVYTVNEGKIGELTQHLYDTLTGIQWGKSEDKYGWTVKL
jgi:hypothetical protein